MVELAGDRMTIKEGADGVTTITFDDKGTGRACGDCQLCCRLVPVPTIGKAAGVKCQFQKYGKGCTIYADRPFACRTWSCRWLSDPETAGMSRPDRCHYVIDCTWDYVTMVPKDGGAPIQIPVIQVWVDPAHRDAHRAPELREYMARVAIKHGAATIIRWSRQDAITVFPPAISNDGEWHERTGNLEERHPPQHPVVVEVR